MRFYTTILHMILVLSLLPAAGHSEEADAELEKSAYFAYVGPEYIFTVEIVKPGVPILNFVSMTDREDKLPAKNIRLSLGNRQAETRLLHIDTDRYQQPLSVFSMRMRPRSSFGLRLEGNFGDIEEIYGSEIRLGDDKFRLAPLSKFDFETLVRKVNRLNLGSPDFRDDFRVLKLQYIGSRSSYRK